ncbi:MAG: hypothetical protein RID53_33285 [Coleofasciculus sp. B1-GNL1-01]
MSEVPQQDPLKLGLPNLSKNQGRFYSSSGFPVSSADATLGTFSK